MRVVNILYVSILIVPLWFCTALVYAVLESLVCFIPSYGFSFSKNWEQTVGAWSDFYENIVDIKSFYNIKRKL